MSKKQGMLNKNNPALWAKTRDAGFTLIELIIVLVIIGILATIAVSHVGIAREKALVKEAMAYLKNIQAVENVVFLESKNFAPCNAGTPCSSALRISLSQANWNYAVVPSGSDFTASASRKSGPWNSCVYNINSTMDNAVSAVAADCP
jgi:prepilin-type N-terminal cleavage/methylation domain-containing protein